MKKKFDWTEFDLGKVLEEYDGKNAPRPIQERAMTHLADSGKIHAQFIVVNAQCGYGKSSNIFALQRYYPNAVWNTANRVLQGQGHGDYKDHGLISVRGKDSYKCRHFPELSCVDVIAVDDEEKYSHAKCEYGIMKRKLKTGAYAIYNPVMYSFDKPNRNDDVILVDEAHKLPSMLMLLSGTSFSHRSYPFSKNVLDSNENLISFLRNVQLRKEQEAIKCKQAGFHKKTIAARNRARTCKDMADKLTESAAYYHAWIKTEIQPKFGEVDVLYIKPIEVERHVYERYFAKARKVFLWSATISRERAEEILGTKDFVYISVPPSIPVENRLVHIRNDKIWTTSSGWEIANAIKKVLENHKGENVLVHCTYSKMKEIAQFFPNAITHTDKNKLEMIAKFKAEGGIFFGAGCSEGVSFDDSTARVNIILDIPNPNREDEVVIKRRELYPERVDLEVLETMVQMVGRTTRSETDFSSTYILNKRAYKFFEDNKRNLPKGFWESIRKDEWQ